MRHLLCPTACMNIPIEQRSVRCVLGRQTLKPRLPASAPSRFSDVMEEVARRPQRRGRRALSKDSWTPRSLPGIAVWHDLPRDRDPTIYRFGPTYLFFLTGTSLRATASRMRSLNAFALILSPS